MGLDGWVKRTLRLSWAPLAFEPRRTHPNEPFAILDDFLIRYKGLPTVGATYSLKELFEVMWRCTHHLMDPQSACVVTVVVIDDKTNVFALKADTQAERVAAAHRSHEQNGVAGVEPYAIGSVLDDDGIIEPDCNVQRICLRRLALSRGIRGVSNAGNDLWLAMVPMIRQAMQACPPGRKFIFDVDKRGPLVFTNDSMEMHADLAHDLGEADPALVWWSHHLRPLTVHWISTDSDLIALYLVWHHRMNGTDMPSVFWHHDRNEMVNMRVLAETLVRRAPLSVLVYAFILCGCDFVHKKFICDGFGPAAIVQATVTALANCVLCHMNDEQILECVLLELWRSKLKGADVIVPEHMRKPRSFLSMEGCRRRHREQSEKSKCPSALELAWQAKLVAAVWAYWYGAMYAKRPNIGTLIMPVELVHERTHGSPLVVQSRYFA